MTVPVLTLRHASYPPRGGHTVTFAWPEGIPESDGEAAIADVRLKYIPLSGWKVLRWTYDDDEPCVIVAHQIRDDRR